jgi:hypothetical protein
MIHLGRMSGDGHAPIVGIRPLLEQGTGVDDDRVNWTSRVVRAGPSQVHADKKWVLIQALSWVRDQSSLWVPDILGEDTSAERANSRF